MKSGVIPGTHHSHREIWQHWKEKSNLSTSEAKELKSWSFHQERLLGWPSLQPHNFRVGLHNSSVRASPWGTLRSRSLPSSGTPRSSSSEVCQVRLDVQITLSFWSLILQCQVIMIIWGLFYSGLHNQGPGMLIWTRKYCLGSSNVKK